MSVHVSDSINYAYLQNEAFVEAPSPPQALPAHDLSADASERSCRRTPLSVFATTAFVATVVPCVPGVV